MASSNTRLTVSDIKFTLNWEIEKAHQLIFEKEDMIKSPIFTEGVNCERKWYLIVHPKGDEEKRKDFVSIYLHLGAQSLANEVEVKFKIQIKDQLCRILFQHGPLFPQSWDKIERGKGRGYPEFIRRGKLFADRQVYIENDTLRIACQVEVQEGPRSKVLEIQIQQDLLKMLESTEFSDITIKCQGKEFYCSKAVLGARSEVFKTMFLTDMKESRTGIIEIEDVSPEALKEVLIFLYTDMTYQYKENTAIEVLEVADLYRLNRLKRMCEEAMMANLSKENVPKLWSVAKKYSLLDLRAAMETFFESCKGQEVADIIDCILERMNINE